VSWKVPKGTWARWGWLITTLALGAAVIGSAWANYQSASLAAYDLIRGEAHTLRDAVLATNRRAGEERRADFDSLVTAHQEEGLRFAAWVETDGTIVVSGGRRDPSPLQVPASSSGPRFDRLSSRVRVYFPPPAPPGRRSDERSPGQSGSTSQSNRPPPPTIVMEFEPVVAAQMVARARRSLFVAGIGAIVLMGAGLGFWRLSQRIEESERRIEAQRRLSTLGEMSAVLAHEIRNPLASLKGHAQLLVERLLPRSAERRKAERVVEEATRLEVLTSDLLDFARTGPMDMRMIDPAMLLRATAADIPGPAIRVDGARAPERWLLDERRIGQAVLANLLRNAVQASPSDRPPEAQVAVENGGLVFTVRDFGPGLPKGSEDRIFDPFFTTKAAGTGLGLAVARRVVELHGGRIVVANVIGGGTSFRVELPRREG